MEAQENNETQLGLNFTGNIENNMHIPGWQKFRAWVDTYGGNKVMEYIHKKSYPYAKRFKKYKRKVSFSLIWELTRDHIHQIKSDAKRRGVDLKKYKGYALCNDLRSYAMRHVIEKHPDWKGMFLMREQGTNKV